MNEAAFKQLILSNFSKWSLTVLKKNEKKNEKKMITSCQVVSSNLKPCKAFRVVQCR